MTENTPASSVPAEVQCAIKEAISKSISDLSSDLTNVIESRLSVFKSDIAEERQSTLESAVKRARRSDVLLKSKGNQNQFDHQQEVLESLTDAKESLEQEKFLKAKEAIQQGITLNEKRMKVIKIADRSEFGWSTANEYLSDDLASDSEDEKRLFRSERRAEQRVRKSKKQRRSKAPAFDSRGGGRDPRGQGDAGCGALPQRESGSNKIGPCYKLSI